MALGKFEKHEREPEEKTPLSRVQSEKYILLPIAEALGIDKKQLERLKYEPSQICGLLIADIKALQRELKRQKKVYKELQQQRAKDSQALFGFLRGYEARGGTK